MRYLVDAHTLVWFMDGDRKLSAKAREQLENKNNICCASIASLWELAIKWSLGKLKLEVPLNEIPEFLAKNEIEILGVNTNHIFSVSSLPFIHRDPFDRIIIAQAIVEDLTLLTADEEIAKYPVKCLW